MHWNRENFDVSNAPLYVQEALDEGKYAFASDYVRLWALYKYGGIYLDSDIEVYRNFDSLLNNSAFTGFEEIDRISAWIFGSEKGNILFKELMEFYDDRKFILGDGKYDTTPNPVPITNTLIEHGLELNGTMQELDKITIYPMDYFCPFNPYREGDDCFSSNTHCNHHFNGSWKKHINEKEKAYQKAEEKYKRIFGEIYGEKIHRHLSYIKHSGFKDWLVWYFRKKD